MLKKSNSDRVVAGVFVSAILLMLCLIIIGFCDNISFYESNNRHNTIETLDSNNNEGADLGINWQDMSPFGVDFEKNYIEKNDSVVGKNLIDEYNDSVMEIKEKIQTYTTQSIPWYVELTELSNRYEKYLNWNIVSYSEYNGITQIDKQYLATLSENRDVSEMVDSITDIAKFCEQKNIDFLYAEQPSKICVYDDKKISGSTDFSNLNMDELLSALQANGVDTYDHRKDIHDEGLNHHDLFYNTDHHWKVETGLWAAKHILDYLNSEYGYKFESSILDVDNYTYEVYQNWFLGSQGKKVTLNVVDPENITLIHPKYENKIHYQIPDLGIDKYGDFDITYEMWCIEEIDYYNRNPYGAYNNGDHALIQFENMMIDAGPKILVVHHSFANCEIPFWAMATKYIDSIDLRYFTGSLKEYINKTNPDIVIVTYNSVTDYIDWLSHKDCFDFR